jgi:DNA-binding transcriptional ArsR family regulator
MFPNRAACPRQEGSAFRYVEPVPWISRPRHRKWLGPELFRAPYGFHRHPIAAVTAAVTAARAVGDPARAAMLLRLMDGCGHSARDLATAAGVSASAASAHLRHLIEAKLITVTVVGRTREHAIASAEVAVAIEALAAIAPLLPVESLRQARAGGQLRRARACYSHLGGELSVADHLADAGAIDALVAASAGQLRHLDAPLLAALHITDVTPGSGPSVRGCLDWTERRPHLAGRLGTTIMRAMLDHSWLTRRPRDRALTITNLGTEQLLQLGLDPASPASSDRTLARSS